VARNSRTSSSVTAQAKRAATTSKRRLVGLLPLGYSRSSSKSASESQSRGAVQLERTTVDETVIPVLMNLKERLMDTVVTPSSSIPIETRWKEYENVDLKLPANALGDILQALSLPVPEKHMKTERARATVQQTFKEKIGSFEVNPSTISIPQSGWS
jgi:hypothetical protein